MIDSVRLTRKALQAAMDLGMAANGWPPRKICGLPSVYARDTLVTPYFACSSYLKMRGGNYYCADGAIGVIHSGFEANWLMQHPELKAKNGLAVLLHIANLRVLSEARLLFADELASEVRIFCDAVSALLLNMPNDERSLKQAFDEDRLCGRSALTFSGYSERPTFYEFVEFVKQLDPNGSSVH